MTNQTEAQTIYSGMCKRSVRLIEGDCLEVLKTLPEGGVDAVVTDPPYPEINRAYGRLTEAEWWDLMMGVCREVRRALKPAGSAVFILQPNSSKVGSMRGWLWEFMAWACREWNMVQDVWWWNPSAMSGNFRGLMRPSLKSCVWLGATDCYRNQDSVLWTESQANQALRATARCGRTVFPSGHSVDEQRISQRAVERGGVVPFNLIPVPNTNSTSSAGAHGHGAGTPLALCRWWTRYICPPGGVVLDPFAGSGTTGIACVREGRDAILIERVPEYCDIIRQRHKKEQEKYPLFNKRTTRPSGVN